MSFVTPGLLLGALLIGVPIVLHLIMRQQPRQLVFPAMRFIQQRQQANRRNLRLRHLILLLLRCAAIALLALALARPSISGSGLIDQEAPIAAALIFDTAPRMDYRHENTTRMAAAQEMGDWLLTQLPAESELAVVDSGATSPGFSAHVGAAKQRIGRLDTTGAPHPLTISIEQAAKLLKTSDKPRKEIYLFTDLARSAWPADGVQRLASQAAELKDVGLYVIDVGVTDPHNFGIDQLRLLPGQIISENSPLRIEARLTRLGPPAERAVGLYLVDRKGNTTQRSQQAHVFEPGAAKTVEFQIGGLDLGMHQGYLKILGEDSLAADDTVYFTVEVRAPWKVLLAAPNPATTKAQFLEQALAPLPFVQRGEARFACDVISIDKLTDAKLEDYAAVCLLDPSPLPAAEWQRLAAFVHDGGGLGIWLGRQARSPEAFNDPAALDVLPGKLVRMWERQEDSLAPENLEHPALRKFKPLGTSIPWDAFPVFQFWQVEPHGDGANVLLPYRGGKPALLERPIGKGRVLMMTTPISDSANDAKAWNLLATGFEPWPFVMLSDGIGQYLVQRGDERLEFAAGDTAVIQLAPQDRESIFSLTTPRGEVVPQTVNQREGIVTISATDQPGNYQLDAGGELDLRRGFSVNLTTAATALERLTPEELMAALPGIEHRVARNREDIDRAVSVGRVGRELYPFLILLLAAVLGAEQFLANRFYRPIDGDRTTFTKPVAAESDRSTSGSSTSTTMPPPPPSAATPPLAIPPRVVMPAPPVVVGSAPPVIKPPPPPPPRPMPPLARAP